MISMKYLELLKSMGPMFFCAIFPKNGTSMSTWGISIYLSIHLSIYNIHIYTYTHYIGMFMFFYVICWGFPKSPSANPGNLSPHFGSASLPAPSRKPHSTAWARTNEPPGGGFFRPTGQVRAGAWRVLRFTWE